MRIESCLAALGLSIGLAAASCDNTFYYVDPQPPAPKKEYKPLDGPRDHVLFNLQTAYNDRNISRFDELIDAGFMFYFSDADVNGVNWTAGESWDRAHEIVANKNLFNPAFTSPTVDAVSDIDLTLTFAPGDSEWTAVPADDPDAFPGETWYEKTVEYTVSVQAGNTTFLGIKKRASFVVRWANVNGKEYWRIVTWRDDVGTSQLGSMAPSAAATEESTWGLIKYLYSVTPPPLTSP